MRGGGALRSPGEPDRGFAVAMGTLDRFRPSVGAFAVGMAEAALAAAVEHAARRHAFGRPLREFQAVSHRLADVATRVQAARLLVHHAATAYDAGIRPVTQVAAMAKLLATQTAQEAVDAAIQVHGAVALENGTVFVVDLATKVVSTLDMSGVEPPPTKKEWLPPETEKK